MDESNSPESRGGAKDPSPDDTVSQSQFWSAVDSLQLQLDALSYDSLDGGQKINLLTIRTLGVVYGLNAIGYLFMAVSTSRLSLNEASTTLQSLLVVFAAIYGIVMIISEIAKRTQSSQPLSVREDEIPSNEG